MDGFDLAKDVWSMRPRPLQAVGQGLWKGGGWGVSIGAQVGGLPGAAIGLGAGAALGTVVVAAQKTAESLRRLEQAIAPLIEHYKAYNPIIARLSVQWELMDRRISRAWGQTLAPILRQASQISMEVRERWERMKMKIFQAIEPFLADVLKILSFSARGLNWLLEKLSNALVRVIGGFEWLFKRLGLISGEEKRSPTEKLKGFDIEWPTVEGPLTAAMRRYPITGPPFTGEEAQRGPEEKEAKIKPAPEYKGPRIPGEWPPVPYQPYQGNKNNEVNVEVKVGDSKELSAIFEQTWHGIAYELRRREAQDALKAYMLQQEGTYV